VIGNILRYATDVDWFIDTDDRSVWYFDQANSQNCYKERIACREGIELELTADQVFGWLKMEGSHFSQIMTVAHSYGCDCQRHLDWSHLIAAIQACPEFETVISSEVTESWNSFESCHFCGCSYS